MIPKNLTFTVRLIPDYKAWEKMQENYTDGQIIGFISNRLTDAMLWKIHTHLKAPIRDIETELVSPVPDNEPEPFMSDGITEKRGWDTEVKNG